MLEGIVTLEEKSKSPGGKLITAPEVPAEAIAEVNAGLSSIPSFGIAPKLIAEIVCTGRKKSSSRPALCQSDIPPG